ncbi:MAG TPA: SNF2-related protein [Polyangiaceae bacterium]|nr:SNF2-related protein [Polyangiaceae bacterium]
MSSLADALSTLSDRGLRRLLGARTFLRGLDYEKRKVVDEVHLNEGSAHGRVKGSDPDPYEVTIRLGGEGITSHCTCPAFQKTGQHCKHVAALLITVRNKARQQMPRREAPPQVMAPPPPPPIQQQQPQGDNGKGSRRRDRRRGRVPTPPVPAVQGHFPPPIPELSARQTGLGAWLSPEGGMRQVKLEFRVHVRQGGLTATVLDVDNRAPLLPSAALAWQATQPSPDRNALRVLARFESGNPRHPAVDIRGEDAAELLPLLRDRRVLLEPALMQLRFLEEPLRPRFDLEMVSDTIVAKVTFERPSDGRRFSLTSGGWFEGAPGYHIDTTEGIARPLDHRVSPAALRRLLRSPTIAEPASELISLITYGLPKVALEVGAELPELSQVVDVIDLTPEFRMRATGSLTQVEASLRAQYGEREVEVRADGISPPIMIMPPEEGQKRMRCIRCDIAAQQLAVQELLELGLKADESGEFFVAEGETAIKFWSEGVGSLPEDWELYIPEELLGTQVRNAPLTMNARVSSGVDWLSVKISYESDGVGVDREELERCLREGKKFVRLSDNSYAPLDPEKVQAMIDREIELIQAGGKAGKIPLSQAGRVQELLQQANSAHVAASAKQLFQKLASIDEIKAAKKPKALKATLRPYQEQGLSWLSFVHEIGSGGVLADDMGLGKTIQTIALLLNIKAEKKTQPLRALIVAPTSVVSNWVREIQRFAPTLTTALWHGAGRKEQMEEMETANVIITSYALLRRDIDLLKKLRLDYAILDEAQNIKNPLSATAQAAKELTADRRLALTGTPIENRLSEIWSIFEFVSPGLLGPLPKFEEKYARPIDNGDSKAASRLRAVIHPFILRRTKIEVAKDLPPKLEVDKLVDLAPDQKAIYLQVLREVRATVMGEVERVGMAKSQLHILAGLTKLRQAACDPRLLGLPREFSHEDSGKLMALRELIDEAESGGHKVLVFSQFVSMLKLVREALEEDKIKYEYLDGSTIDRAERVDRFQEDPTVPVFLISLKAGGSGLNLTAADTVIHFDPWWNPAVEDQASDRAHRIGQKKVVTVYRLVAAGTIEEKILQLKQKKKDLVSSVLSEDAGGAKTLSRDDLDDLFKVD